MKRILLMFLGMMTWEGALGQTIFNWRSEAANGNWFAPTHWWNGSASVTAGFGVMAFNNNAHLSMTNNNGGSVFSTHAIRFDLSNTSARTIAGDGIRLFDNGGANPYIENNSSANHVIGVNLQGDGDAGDPLEIRINSSGGLTINGGINNQGAIINVQGTTASSTTVALNGIISGAGGLFKTNANITLDLGGANTYTGTTTISAGTIRLTGSGTLGNNSNVRISSGGTLNLNGVNATVGTVAEEGFANGGVINLGSATLTITGNNVTELFQNSISGSGGVIKNGTGALSLYGSQTFTGNLQINGGQVSTASSLAAANIIVENGATFRITGNVSINNLEIKAGGTLLVNTGNTLTVVGVINNAGTITNNGTLILSATNETTYAQLLTNGSVTGDITVQRAITGTTQGWRFFSPATSGTQNNLGTGLLFAAGGPANVINLSNGNPNAWQGVGGNTATALTPGRGYGVFFGTDGVNGTATNGTITTTGSIQTSNVTVSGLTNGNSGSSFGWALVGNPFTAGFNFGDAANTKTNIDNTVWIWNPTSSGGSGAYASYNYTTSTSAPSGALNGIIPPAQGFVIKVNATSPVLTMATAARTTATPNAQMRTSSALNRLYLAATNTQNGFNDELALVSWPTASTSFESDVDALKLNSFTANAVNFSSKSSDNRLLAINTTAVWNDQLSIPLNLACTDAAAMKIEANLQEVDPSLPVILEDRFLNRYHNMRQGAYQFAHVPAQADRFVIHFAALATSVENNQLDKLLIYTAGESLFIKGAEGTFEVSLYDVQGRKVRTFVGNADQEWNISELPKGAYVVHAQFTDGVKSFKVVR